MKEKLKAMDGQRWPVRCGLALSSDDAARLREGVWPLDMDDCWEVWLDGRVLRAWRSWTRNCVYEVQVLLTEDGSAVASAFDEPEDYARARTDAVEMERSEGVIGLALNSQVA